MLYYEIATENSYRSDIMPNKKKSSILIMKLRSYLHVTVILDFMLYFNCFIRVFHIVHTI